METIDGTVTPHGDLVLVAIDRPADFQSGSGLIVPQDSQIDPVLGTVVLLGNATEGCYAPGDHVLFPHQIGVPFETPDHRLYKLIAERAILGRYSNPATT